MTKILLTVAALVAGTAATRLLLVRLIPGAPLTRRNYRGLAVPTGLGLTPIAGILAGAALVALVHAVAPGQRTPALAHAASMPAILLVGGFGLLGMFDDLFSAASPDGPRGFRGHLAALREGRVTGGGIKMLGGIALSLVAAALTASGIGMALAGGALIALCANLFNSLDVRPGRSIKIFLVAAVPLALFGGMLRPIYAAAAGGAAVFLREDLRERAMLGDTGSNALGALVGYSVIALAPGWPVLLVLGLVGALTVVAEGPTLSAMIAKVAPLRAFDRAGRVPETENLLDFAS